MNRMPSLEELLKLVEPVNGSVPNPLFVVLYHLFMAFLVVIILSTIVALLTNTTSVPKNPIGWSNIDYDANQINRESFASYLEANNIPDTTPMVQFSVATANFGGIFTEDMALLSPWVGSVHAEAARLQVEAGARAVVFDIWPDPGDPQKPVVASMLDTNEWAMQRWWKNNGLEKGVGRYSNWQLLTRNTGPVSEIFTTTLETAFNAGHQGEDPFFLILNLHGAMTIEYLNYLGHVLQKAIGGRAMGPEWNKFNNQKNIGTAPVSAFLSKVFLIVIPDIQPGYNSLPHTNTYSGFTTLFLQTRLGEITNMLEQNPNTVRFDPGNISAISSATQPNLVKVGGPLQSAAQNGFCLVQPTIGGQTTDNTKLFANNGYTTCIQSGAQFVAINLFSPNSADGPMNMFFNPSYFSKYSFRKQGGAS
jgi:hypothetical protein